MAKKFFDKEAALNYIDTLPMSTIRTMLAEYLVDNQAEKIIITEEQFRQFFKIRGVSYDPQTGEEKRETRGRKPKAD